MIRRCSTSDAAVITAVINDAAEAYRGKIAPDCFHDPYMSLAELEQELARGVEFWGFYQDDELVGVMGLQDRGPVSLIRHAYVRTRTRGKGVGTQLLKHLEQLTDKAILIGTWLDATWAVSFYEKHGYRQLTRDETDHLLHTYWSLPERQVETSVVLANAKWHTTTVNDSQHG